MKIIVLVLLCLATLSASAQWDFSKDTKYTRYTIAQIKDHSFNPKKAELRKLPKLYDYSLGTSEYYLEAAENDVMKTAQHNMRFRAYNLASYNFSDLAQLYVQQGRFSEAKWYYLQSSNISRQQNNDKLTIANLVQLAGIKASIGDFMLAQDDLMEARDMASSHGWLIDLIAVEKKYKNIQIRRIMSARPEMRYASNALDPAPLVTAATGAL